MVLSQPRLEGLDDRKDLIQDGFRTFSEMVYRRPEYRKNWNSNYNPSESEPITGYYGKIREDAEEVEVWEQLYNPHKQEWVRRPTGRIIPIRFFKVGKKYLSKEYRDKFYPEQPKDTQLTLESTNPFSDKIKRAFVVSSFD